MLDLKIDMLFFYLSYSLNRMSSYEKKTPKTPNVPKQYNSIYLTKTSYSKSRGGTVRQQIKVKDKINREHKISMHYKIKIDKNGKKTCIIKMHK